jgi:membrane-associated phospholipid phosphatase
VKHIVGFGLALALCGAAAKSSAQTLPSDTARGGGVIHAWQGAAVLGGVVAASVLDESVRSYAQRERSPGSDAVAATARRLGQPEVFVTVPAALFAVGVVTGRAALRRAGGRIAGSLALAAVVELSAKLAVGRLRPSQVEEPYDLRPFSGADAFPSGHTTMAFALATSLADEIRRPWASAGLFVAATGTAWSRVNDNRHWLSDVAAGAVVGIGAAQVMEGRWRVFHVRPPAVLFAPGVVGVEWRERLP